MFFIVSTGRSGTTTLARKLAAAGSCCWHEPVPNLAAQASAFRYGVLEATKLRGILKKTRKSRVKGKVYGESNQNLSFIIPVLAKTFPGAKFIWLIRNGLDFVASGYQKQLYSGHSENHDRYEDCPPNEKEWIDGRIQGDLCRDVLPGAWRRMGRFEKICWYWSYVNRLIEKDLEVFVRSGFRILKLENLTTDFPGIVQWLGLSLMHQPKREKFNVAKRPPYRWREWTQREREVFEFYCGPLMDWYYPEWRTENGGWKDIPYDGSSQTVFLNRPQAGAGTKVSPAGIKISVYITSYNQKNFLKEAIESVLAQTRKPCEIIVADDASTDGSCGMIREYHARYPDLIRPLYHPENLGVTKTRNHALALVRGDWVTGLDGDDRFCPEKLEREADFLARNPGTQVVFSDYFYLDPEGRRKGRWAEFSTPPSGEIFLQTFARDFPRGGLFRMEMVRTDALKSLGFYDERLRLYEDYDLRIRLAHRYPCVYLDEPLSEKRDHPSGLSRSGALEHWRAVRYVYRRNKALLAGYSAREARYVRFHVEGFLSRIAGGVIRDARFRENVRRRKPLCGFLKFRLLKPAPAAGAVSFLAERSGRYLDKLRGSCKINVFR